MASSATLSKIAISNTRVVLCDFPDFYHVDTKKSIGCIGCKVLIRIYPAYIILLPAVFYRLLLIAI